MIKQKILFILPGFTFGGTVFSTLNMIPFLKKDYDVYVLPMTYQGPVIKKYKETGVKLLPESLNLSTMVGKIERENNIYRKIFFLYRKILRKILLKMGCDYELKLFKKEAIRIEKKYSFDYVASCQEGASTYFASCFKNSKRIGWFRSEYSVYKTENNHSVLEKEQIIYPKFDNIVCVSQTTREDFISYFPDLSSKVLAIHNIQNVSTIQCKANELISDFPQSEFVIVSIGRMNPQKRFSYIPQIARKLIDKGCCFKWIIIGDGNTFGEWDKLQDQIISNNVSDVVLCLGSKLNPYPYISKANLLVNTSYVEACPRVVIEAKILKTPVICADFSSAREFVASNIDGFVDSIDNIHTYIEKMIHDRVLYNRIKTKCNEYNIDNGAIYNQLKKLFQ